MKKGIITNKKVDKTFEGVECLLFREIISSRKTQQDKTYVVRTTRCNWEDKVVPDENSEVEGATKTIQELKFYDQKDRDVPKRYSFAKIDAFFKQIKTLISADLSYMEIENTAEQLALFEQTKADKAFGTLDTDWELIDLNK